MDKGLRRSLIARGIFVILRPALWYCFFAFTVFHYVVFGKYRADPRNPLVYVAAFLILTLPFFMGWIRSALCVPAFDGEIERVKVKTYLKGDTFVSKYSSNHRIVSEHIYRIRTRRGCLIRFRIKEPNFEYAHRFPNGTKIRHRFGAPFFERAKHISGDDYLCIACGTLCREEQKICYECGNVVDKQT